MGPSRALAHARTHRARFLEELKAFIRFPTVSAQPAHAPDLRRCAAWLARHLASIGLERVRIIPGGRHPIVYAEWRHAARRPTVLVYGHYDVQPADPLREWRSPPFQPTVRGADIYGRGACDDKGQMFTHVKALESYLKTAGRLPVNVRCLFEGEEEIGSPSLLPFIARNKRHLRADVALVSDTRMLAPDRPAINYAERGALGLEVEIQGPGKDLHSGNFGGAVHNPLQVLCEVVASLHEPGGRIAIAGFYDRVRRWSDDEREFMEEVGPTDSRLLRDAEVKDGWGERGFSSYERITIRPALTVNGIAGGYQGPGVKGVIPARARAKLSFRLVPDQDPHDVDRLLRRHVARVVPSTVRATVRTLSAAKPALVNRAHPAMQAAALAYRQGFGASPVFLRSGGTIPVVSTFQEELGIPTILLGFALPDDNIHAPNEKFHLPNFYRGITTSTWFLQAIGAGAAHPRITGVAGTAGQA